jgi:putative DNA primase/helicase
MNNAEFREIVQDLTTKDIATQDIPKLSLIDTPNLNSEKNKTSEEDNSFSLYAKDAGIFYCKNGQLPVWLCARLEISALTRDPNNENWGRVLEFKDADRQSHQWIMPDAMLKGNGEQVIGELLRLGLNIHSGQKERKHLLEYISSINITDRVRCVPNIGWYKKSFVLPHKVYNQPEETLVYQSDYSLYNYEQTGSLENWKDKISSLCIGNTRLIFALSLALSGPLVGLVGSESGGFHLLGESSIGKSTLLAVAASVYGSENYVHNLRATDNALEGLAIQHNHTLLILDELSQLNPRIAGEVFYMLANGQSKSRAFKTGQAKNRQHWRLHFFSSGELSLKSLLEAAGLNIRAGQEIRSANISADAGKGYGVFDTLHSYKDGATLSNSLKKLCQQYHGSAIDAFLIRLVKEDKETIANKVKECTDKLINFIHGDKAHGQVKRVAGRFALVSVAGDLATEWGITGWEKENAYHAALACFISWLKNGQEWTAGSYEEEKMLEQARHFFESQSSRFNSFHIKGPSTRNRAGFVDDTQYKTHSGDFYVFPETFRKEICKGFEPQAVSTLLLRKGFLLTHRTSGKVDASIYVPALSRTARLYHFPAHIIGPKEVEKN